MVVVVMGEPLSPVSRLGHLADVDPSGAGDGQVLVWDDTAGEWVPGPGGGLDPDEPLDYLTFRDTADDTLWQVEITNGAWTFTDISSAALITEGGDTLITEAGDTLMTEG